MPFGRGCFFNPPRLPRSVHLTPRLHCSWDALDALLWLWPEESIVHHPSSGQGNHAHTYYKRRHAQRMPSGGIVFQALDKIVFTVCSVVLWLADARAVHAQSMFLVTIATDVTTPALLTRIVAVEARVALITLAYSIHTHSIPAAEIRCLTDTHRVLACGTDVAPLARAPTRSTRAFARAVPRARCNPFVARRPVPSIIAHAAHRGRVPDLHAAATAGAILRAGRVRHHIGAVIPPKSRIAHTHSGHTAAVGRAVLRTVGTCDIARRAAVPLRAVALVRRLRGVIRQCTHSTARAIGQFQRAAVYFDVARVALPVTVAHTRPIAASPVARAVMCACLRCEVTEVSSVTNVTGARPVQARAVSEAVVRAVRRITAAVIAAPAHMTDATS